MQAELTRARTNGNVATADERAAEPAAHRLLAGTRGRVALFRIGFGLFWAINAWYKWQPAFLHSFAANFTRPGRNAPAMLKPWFQFWQHAITPHAGFFGVCTALLETVIAACLLLGLGRRSIYVVGAVFSLLIWAVPESLGRFWTAGQTDLGTSIIYTFIFVALYIVDAGAAAGGWSLDRAIERRAPAWSVVAEP